MPTTTVVFRFTYQDSQEVMAETVREFTLKSKPPLLEFFQAQGIPTDTDNLVSETIDYDTGTRTVVRSWDTLEIANAWLETMQTVPTSLTYPGNITSSQVDPA
jgi:hypothetical protein